jgi:hypothetical protein
MIGPPKEKLITERASSRKAAKVATGERSTPEQKHGGCVYQAASCILIFLSIAGEENQ